MVDLPGFPDVGALARRLLNRAQAELVQRVLGAAGSIILAEGQAVQARVTEALDGLMQALGALPHAVADWIVDRDRGPDARNLTAGEARHVRAGYGNRQPPSLVRIVRGPGLSGWAAMAFLKGNPAITIGNTIYIKSDHQVPHHDLSQSAIGVELLLHEYTHVIQWKTLGYVAFGRRYVSDIRQCGMAQLYEYEQRQTTYNQETLEGQAQMVGHYAGLLFESDNAGDAIKLTDLRRRLAGTGIYGL